MLSGIPVGVVLLDAAGGVIALNPAFAELMGLPPGLPRPRSAEELDSLVEMRDAEGAPLPEGQSPMQVALAGGSLGPTPMLALAPGYGAARPMTCSVAPIEEGGQRVGAIVVSAEPVGPRPEHADLEASQAALRVLVADRERVQAEERRRIARDLHDDLQQSLAALNMRLGMAEDALDHDADEARQWLQEAQHSVIEASRSTRRIIEDLRPQGLYHRPLVSALRDLVAGFTDRTGVPCAFAPTPAEMPEPPEEVADCLYRIAQESLTNVAKHADATQVEMRLDRADDGTMRLSVIDDGRGLDEPTARYRPGSYGLVGMSERVRALNGEMRIKGRPGHGTTVEADIPVPRAPSGRE